MLKLMDKKNNQYFTLNKMFITSIDMHLLNISKQCRPWSRATSIVFDQYTRCWQQLMHNTFITPAQTLERAGIAVLRYLGFTFGPMVHKEESF